MRLNTGLIVLLAVTCHLSCHMSCHMSVNVCEIDYVGVRPNSRMIPVACLNIHILLFCFVFIERGKESNCFGVLCYTVLLLFIVGIIMAVLFKENLNELNSYIDIFIKQARTYLDQLKKALNK